MDIATLRMGLAHSALRATLGDELFPISFAQGSFAFIDRRSGSRFFCSAENSTLPIMRVEPDGTLGSDHDSECVALRKVAEPLYLASWSRLARDFDQANSLEARAASVRHTASAEHGFPQSTTIQNPLPASHHGAHAHGAPSWTGSNSLDNISMPNLDETLNAPRVELMEHSPEPIAAMFSPAPGPRFSRAPRKMPTPVR